MATRTIGALWVRKSKSGVQYMSGVINDLSGDIQIAVFKNNKKEKENHPDYQIVLSEKQVKEEVKKADEMATNFFDHVPNSETSATLPVDEDDVDMSKIPF